MKTLVKKAAKAGDEEQSRSVEAQFDKAASKGIIHPNKAARKKSRLSKARKAATATPVKKTAKTAKKSPAKKSAASKKSAK
ncbi:MAG: hypothetical protein NVS9B12_02570 [Vulcanimicrobiaceae bacterium]